MLVEAHAVGAGDKQIITDQLEATVNSMCLFNLSGALEP